MSVFISWSGERSQRVAEALRDWLPNVIQKLDVWMSKADIEKGTQWRGEIRSHLDSSSVGIICLTPENLTAPWLLFESGALSKVESESGSESRVLTYLYDIGASDVEEPLAQYQATIANEEDTKELVLTINRNIDEELRSPSDRVEAAFGKFWPDLKDVLDAIPQPRVERHQPRSTQEIAEETLNLVRQIARDQGTSPVLGVPGFRRVSSVVPSWPQAGAVLPGFENITGRIPPVQVSRGPAGSLAISEPGYTGFFIVPKHVVEALTTAEDEKSSEDSKSEEGEA